jgi:hypothetical protein
MEKIEVKYTDPKTGKLIKLWYNPEELRKLFDWQRQNGYRK